MEIEADCGIINLWYGNVHGAILTAYALQCVLRDLGYTSKLISTMPELYKPITEESYKEARKGGISEQFEAKYLDTTDIVYMNKTMSELNGRFRFFLTGSDQVFRAEWVDDKYFLDFVKLDTPKIAVAASFGTENPVLYKTRKKKIAYLLSRFNAVSVREESGVTICKTIAGKNAEWIADPVFLASIEDYQRLLHPIQAERQYCCCYFRDEDEELRNAVGHFAKERDCDIIYITEKTSVEDFLSLIHDAAFMITDSYHGLCFSLIFNTPVYCYYNELRGNARFDSLIKMFELPREAFVRDHIADLSKTKPIGYFDEINQLVGDTSEEGRRYLRETMQNAPKVKKSLVGQRWFRYMLFQKSKLLIGKIKRNRANGEIPS